jgi:phage terminase large subunit
MTPTPSFVIPPAFKVLFKPARYKVFHGGRGSGKSHSMATALVVAATKGCERVLCCREFQTSLSDSVHQPFFPESLDIERRHLLAVDPEAYQHARLCGRRGFSGPHGQLSSIK